MIREEVTITAPPVDFSPEQTHGMKTMPVPITTDSTTVAKAMEGRREL
jgi:hypothetical protein